MIVVKNTVDDVKFIIPRMVRQILIINARAHS